MRKQIIIMMSAAMLIASCKKKLVEHPSAPKTPPGSPKEIPSVIKAVFNYSTTITSGLTKEQLIESSVDTTYYELWKGNKIVLSWKANWNFNDTIKSNIKNLRDTVPYNPGEILTWKIIHRTHRNVDGYQFNCGVSSTKNYYSSWFHGMYSARRQYMGDPFYTEGVNTFAIVMQGVTE